LRARGSFRAAPDLFKGQQQISENQPVTGPIVHDMFSLKADREKESISFRAKVFFLKNQ
jgi:hypothetical protein